MLADDMQDPRNQTTKNFDDANLRSLVARSHRFVLDAEATRLCVNIAHQGPERIAELLQLARLPYEQVWIEVPLAVKFDEQKRLDPDFYFEPVAPDCMVGYYLERDSETGWRVSVTQHDRHGAPRYAGWPLGYRVDSELELDRNDHYKPSLELDSTALIWGYDRNKAGLDYLMNRAGLSMHPSVLEDMMMRVERNFPAGTDIGVIIDGIAESRRRQEVFDQFVMPMARELTGTVRFMVAVLSTITCVPVEYVDVKRKGMRLINRKPKPYFAYRETRLMLPRRRPKNPVEWAYGYVRREVAKKRRHKVMAHWRVFRNGTKTWVHEHYRGDASVGYVDSKTVVSARKKVDTPITDQ